MTVNIENRSLTFISPGLHDFPAWRGVFARGRFLSWEAVHYWYWVPV